MSERPKITSEIIEPTESCNDNDLGFFERPSKEFKICQQDNNASEFSDYMKDNPEASFKDIISKTILIKNEYIKDTIYDPLKYYPKPPVIGILNTKVNQERTEYLSFEESYGDDYNIITTDIGDIGGNGVFIDYNGKKGLLTAAHVGRPLYRGFKDKTPGNIANGRLDSAFIYLDDNFYTHVHNTDNFAKTSPIRIENTKNSKSINGKIVTTIGYDKGGNFHELYDSLKSESGVAIEITPEYDDYITDTLVSRAEGLRRKKLYESRRGTYVGRYLYRITGDQNRQGGGLSGSPIFSKGELVGILTGGVFLDGKHFSVFSPLSKIYDDMLSDLDE